MIKIINEGRKEQFVADCWECGCVFEYGRIDMVRNISSQYVKCPWCGADVYVKPNKEGEQK